MMLASALKRRGDLKDNGAQERITPRIRKPSLKKKGVCKRIFRSIYYHGYRTHPQFKKELEPESGIRDRYSICVDC